MKKKICSLLLALLMLVTMLPVTTMATASNDYTQWRQSDSEWNQEEAWPASQYPNASYALDAPGWLFSDICGNAYYATIMS